MSSCDVCSCVCPSVWVSVTFVYSVETNKHIFKTFPLSSSHTILLFTYQTLWQYSDRDLLSGTLNPGGVGKNRDSPPIPGSIACCERFDRQVHYTSCSGPWQVGDTRVTLIAGKRCRLFFTGNDDEVFMTRSPNVTPKTTEQHLIVRSGKSEAEVTNNKRLRSTYCMYCWS